MRRSPQRIRSFMFGHDIIVIGASVGGVDALPRLIGSLPAGLTYKEEFKIEREGRTPYSRCGIARSILWILKITFRSKIKVVGTFLPAWGEATN
jgi:hypothetical protein